MQNGGGTDELKPYKSSTGGSNVAQIIERINKSNSPFGSPLNSSEIPKKRTANSFSDSGPVSRVKSIVQNIEATKNPMNSGLSKALVPPPTVVTTTTGEVIPKACRSIEERRHELMQSAQRKPVQRNRTILRASGFPRLQPVSTRKEVLLKRVAGPAKLSTDSSSSPEISPTNKAFTSGLSPQSDPVKDIDSPMHFRGTSLESGKSGTWTVLHGPQSVLVNRFSADLLDNSQSVVATAADDLSSLDMRLSQSLDIMKNSFLNDQNS